MAERFELGAAGDQPAVTVAGATSSYADLHRKIAQVQFSDGVLDLAGLNVFDTMAGLFAAALAGVPVLIRAPDSVPLVLPELPADAFLVVLTSGTTGRARAVVRTAQSWSTSFHPLAQFAGLRSKDAVLLTGPLHSTLHLFAAVHTLWLGAHLTDDPVAATAVHGVPAVVMDLLTVPPPRLRTVVVAGSVFPAGLETRAIELGLTLIEYYGAAELSFVAARVAPEKLRPFPGVEVRIQDGELWVRSPYLAIGRLSADGRRLTPLRRRTGFATAGDRAVEHDDGALTLRGRGDGAVTTGGHTVLVEDVEAVLAAVPGIAAVAVVGTPHVRLGEVVTAVVELTDGADLAAVRRAARGVLTGAWLPRRWQVVSALPTTAGGKVARAQIAGRYRDDPCPPRRPADRPTRSS